jgi:zinc-binding in reverse transcriptase
VEVQNIIKIKIFTWLVRKRKILTKDNLVHRGWTEDISCVFCGVYESLDHFFVKCSVAHILWTWIANYNSFTFQGNSLNDLWFIDSCIPLKDKFLVELIRSAVF